MFDLNEIEIYDFFYTFAICSLIMGGVYSSNYEVLYTIEISMTRRFNDSVGPFFRPFVTLLKCLLLLHY